MKHEYNSTRYHLGSVDFSKKQITLPQDIKLMSTRWEVGAKGTTSDPTGIDAGVLPEWLACHAAVGAHSDEHAKDVKYCVSLVVLGNPSARFDVIEDTTDYECNAGRGEILLIPYMKWHQLYTTNGREPRPWIALQWDVNTKKKALAIAQKLKDRLGTTE